MFPIMFKTGQALPLVFTRILRPRIGRGDYPRQPRDIHRSGPRTRQIREFEQSPIRTHTHTIRVREQSVSARSPRPQTRSHTGHNHELITASQVREQAFAAAKRCPQAVRNREPSMSANSSQTRIVCGPQQAGDCPHWRILVSMQFPTRFPVRIGINFSYVLI